MKLFISLPLLSLLIACQPVGIADQARLSQPIFDFAATGSRSMECGLTGQIETGRTTASNVSAGGCASCR